MKLRTMNLTLFGMQNHWKLPKWRKILIGCWGFDCYFTYDSAWTLLLFSQCTAATKVLELSDK